MSRGANPGEERYRRLIEALPYAFYAVDAEGLIVEANDAMGRLLGRPPGELIGRTFQFVIAEEDLPRTMATFEAALAGELERGEIEIRVVRPDGERRRIHVAFETMMDGDTVLGSHGLARDITEERETAERLARSEARLAAMLRRMPVVAWTVDRELRVTWGRGLDDDRDVDGLPLAEAIGEHASLEDVLRAHRVALGGHPFVYRLEEWEGHAFEVRVEPLREEGEVVGVIGVGIDVTERQETRRQLAEQRAYLRELFRAAPEGIVIIGPDGTVLRTNPEFQRMFGYEEDELQGRRIPDLIVPEERLEESTSLRDRVRGGRQVSVEAVRRRKDGTPIHVSILASPVEVEGEERLLGIYRDITEQKRLEEQLLHSQRLEAVGQLAGGIAHDFNNILTAILGLARVWKEEDVDPRLREDMTEIERSAGRAAELTAQLLSFSRRQMTHREPVSLNDVVTTVEDLLEHVLAEGVLLETALAPDLPPAELDRSQVEQVVTNLVLNAAESIEHDGTIRVSTGRGSAGTVFVEVTDDGRGMTSEVRARMFEPFFTTKGPGRGPGLGLSMVYGFVEQAGGRVEVETAPGEGTSVRVVLPASEVSASAPERPPAPGERVAADGWNRVLLVDDDRPVREVTRRILERQGFRVRTAASGREALDHLRGMEAPPHLLLTDVVMPEMSGPELADSASRLWPGIPVLFMSGYTENELSTRSGFHGTRHFISKPFDPATLARRVREAMEAGDPAD